MTQVTLSSGHSVGRSDEPAAQVWLPRDGRVVAKIQPMKGNLRWLRGSVGIRAPRLIDKRWHLPRNCLVRLVTASIDRFGQVVVFRDMSKLSRCTRACLQAQGLECDCSCLGLHHGQDSDAWFERVGDVMVADLGGCQRTRVVYGPKGVTGQDGDAQIYTGQLHGYRYRSDRVGRRGWPVASQFMCSGCLSVRASVWDHCHTHGYVRAPLCATCNTRYWNGWDAAYGRTTPSSNVDTSYYGYCDYYQPYLPPWERGSCSA